MRHIQIYINKIVLKQKLINPNTKNTNKKDVEYDQDNHDNGFGSNGREGKDCE